MSALVLRLLFGVASAWPFWWGAGPGARRQRWLLCSCVASLVAVWVPAERVFFDRVDGRLLSLSMCGR